MSAVFARVIRRRMREESVTIRQLASAMKVTIKRVREIRNEGGPPPKGVDISSRWRLDWFDGIRRAAELNHKQLSVEIHS